MKSDNCCWNRDRSDDKFVDAERARLLVDEINFIFTPRWSTTPTLTTITWADWNRTKRETRVGEKKSICNSKLGTFQFSTSDWEWRNLSLTCPRRSCQSVWKFKDQKNKSNLLLIQLEQRRSNQRYWYRCPWARSTSAIMSIDVGYSVGS